MLKRFEVENIKNFENRVIFDLSDVHDYRFNQHCIKNGIVKNATIYGRNAIGKSNLGMALFDIVLTLTDGNSYFLRKKFVDGFLNADSEQEYAEFVYVFQFDNIEVEYVYQKSNIDTIIGEKLTIDNQIIFNIKDNISELFLEKIGLNNLNIDFKPNNVAFLRYIIKNSMLENDSILRKLYNFVSGMLWVRSFENNQLIPFVEEGKSVTQFLFEKKLIKEYSDFLYNFGIENEIQSDKALDGKETLYFKFKNRNVQLFFAASSGTLSLTTLFFALHSRDQITFLWLDEFDSFYHFELSEKVLTYLTNEFEFQTMFTTHNTNLLSNNIMRPDCYFILTKQRLTSLPNATNRELREGHNLEKLFMGGEFEEVDEET